MDLVESKKFLETKCTNKMQDLKIYGISLGGITFSIMPDINPLLQTIVLVLTIIYTIIGIKNKLNQK